MDIDWKVLPSLTSLRAFELTARSGSFASAARELNVTHAAIAQRVRSLETHLGAQLARRSGRTVVLTEAGTRLAQCLNDGFGTIASGIGELKAEQTKAPLQVAATVHFSQAVILPKLHEFWEDCPEVQVSVMPSQDIEDIVSLGLDLAIRTAPTTPVWPGLKAEPLVECELIVIGAPSIVKDDMGPLEELPWIWSAGVRHEEEGMKAFGLDTRSIKNNDVGVPFLQFSLVRQGLGLAIAPEVLVREELRSGQLCKVPVSSPLSVTYYAVTPLGTVPPRVKAFISWLRKAMEREKQTP